MGVGGPGVEIVQVERNPAVSRASDLDKLSIP